MAFINRIAHTLSFKANRVFVAYSGGVDSHVLLHICAQQAELKSRLQAVYIDHGLQAVSAEWGVHCQQQAAALGVPCQVIRVSAQAARGDSPEAAAREARYQALAELLDTDDVLLLAQHREDQLETFLLQLVRGSGLAGLSAMPLQAPLGKGLMIRPLLDTSKAEIQAYAGQQGLHWVDDPSNQSDQFDRNFLRNQVLPLLKQRWPSLDKTVARSARHCQQAWAQLQIHEWDALCHQPQLDLQAVKTLDVPQRLQAVRGWLQHQGLRPPSEAQLRQIQQQFLDVEPSSQARVGLQQRVIRAYRQRLYCLAMNHEQAAENQCWPQDTAELIATNGYRLRVQASEQGIAQSLWQQAQVTIRPRSGGEKLHLAGREGQHSLKNLYQEVAIPPWQRAALPLLYLDDRLAAVPGLWVASWAWQSSGACYWPVVDH